MNPSSNKHSPKILSRQLSSQEVSKFIGIPWKKGARTYEACDCAGLVYLFYKDIYGIDLAFLPARDYPAGKEALEELNRQSQDAFNYLFRVEKPSTGDIVLINNYGYLPTHLGIYLSPGVMLHSAIRASSCIGRYDSPAFKNKIEGFYRYHE